MKGLVSLAVVVAFFVAVPQCLGQSQDAEKDAGQLLEEQQLVQMFQLAMMAKEKETNCTDDIDNDSDGKKDCDDPNCKKDPACDGGGGNSGPATILICHFSPNGMHCGGDGGLPRTIKNTMKAIDQHNAHMDCSGVHIDLSTCLGHCLCDGGEGGIPPPPE